MDGWEIFKMYSLMQQHLVFIQQYGEIQNQLTHSNFFKTPTIDRERGYRHTSFTITSKKNKITRNKPNLK